jgi:nitrate/TMAO reductase-like tetraheme cytochrome c subunit
MKKITRNRRSVLVLLALFLCVFFAATCVDKTGDSTNNTNSTSPQSSARSATYTPRVTRAQFAGSASCANCHKEISAAHLHTAHFLTTRPATAAAIKGSFQPGRNRFAYSADMVVVMEKRDSGFFQVAYYQGAEKVVRRFDIVVGSGAVGQTYLTRAGNQLYQLPVSYFTAAKQWANSPLFPTHPVLFNRPITSRCLECHSTYAQTISPPNREPEQFDQQQMILGVDCEKCHGPAAQHVAFQSANPTIKTAKYIVNPRALSRQQNLDLCALCHGGRLQKTKPSFEFQPGDTLSNYFRLGNAPPEPGGIDVHGNQYGLLRASQCFIKSNTMTCNTCHSPHTNERGNLATFSQRCMTCHNTGHDNTAPTTHAMACTEKTLQRALLARNCIDCHMPLQASRSITELLPGDKTPTAALIRSHYISIYPPATTKPQARK